MNIIIRHSLLCLFMLATRRFLLSAPLEITLNCGLVRLMVGKKHKCSLSAPLLRVPLPCVISLYSCSAASGILVYRL